MLRAGTARTLFCPAGREHARDSRYRTSSRARRANRWVITKRSVRTHEAWLAPLRRGDEDQPPAISSIMPGAALRRRRTKSSRPSNPIVARLSQMRRIASESRAKEETRDELLTPYMRGKASTKTEKTKKPPQLQEKAIAARLFAPFRFPRSFRTFPPKWSSDLRARSFDLYLEKGSHFGLVRLYWIQHNFC
jgi:hypothetical protein